MVLVWLTRLIPGLSKQAETPPLCCRCKEGRVGALCECNRAESGEAFDSYLCRRDNASEVCSGRGECVCGKCVCRKSGRKPVHAYYGEFCECSDFSCDQYRGQQCGGEAQKPHSRLHYTVNKTLQSCFTLPGQGRCVCGACRCHPEFRGRACECPLSPESCLSQDKQICSGRGDCHCGACICHDNRFRGPTCELCPSCPSVCTLHRYSDLSGNIINAVRFLVCVFPAHSDGSFPAENASCAEPSHWA